MEYVTYKIRWLILAGLWFSTTNRQFTATGFSINNNIVAQYFRVTPYQVDILTIADTILAIFVCFLLSVIGRNVGVRAQTLLVALCMTLGNLLSSIAFMDRSFYWCLVIGRVVSGVSVGLLYILPAAFANRWFSPDQVATAFAIPFFGYGFGGIVSSVAFTKLLPAPISTNISIVSPNALLLHEHEIAHVRFIFCVVFGASSAVMACNGIVFYAFCKDKPPTPPSEAQALIASIHENKKNPAAEKSSIMRVVGLLKNKSFLLLTAANFLSCSALIIVIVLMPSLIRATFPDISNKPIAFLNVVTFVSGSFVGLLAGKALDMFGWYKSLSCAGALLTVIFGVGVFFGHLYKNLTVLSVLYPLTFVSRAFTVTTYVEFLVETTYPTNPTVLTSLHFAFYNLAFFVMSSLERLTMNVWGASYVILVPVVANILALICLLMVKPDYKRSIANSRQKSGL